MAGYRLGIDIGGTFTDLALVPEHGASVVLKISSTPEDYARGVLDGARQILAQAGVAPESVSEVVHGTTVGTNTLLQRRGARTGLLTTRGFRDILEIRRMRLPRLYDLTWERPPPLVERAFRLEVDERLDASGAVVRPLDEQTAVEAIERLVASGVEAIAVCFLHSYANPVHEARVGALLRDLAPHVFVSLSHEVLPQIQEYERTSTTVINAYLGPALGRYLERMEAGLAALGLRAPLLVMQSNGGTMTATAARRLPAQLVESGPAAGAIAAAALAQSKTSPPAPPRDGEGSVGAPPPVLKSPQPSKGHAPPSRFGKGVGGLGPPQPQGEAMVLALDMGGTTAKAALLQDGRVSLTSEAEIGAGVTVANRLNRGGGYLLSLPSVDLVEVGAGGGSLLWIDTGGVLCVGPQSAGAAPGPACYAAGGDEPALTDANVVLGYLNPRWLLGGTLALDAAAARRAVDERVARPLGLSIERAAYGAHRVAIASMVRAVRAVSAERGHDPQRAALVAFGGNGPLHAAAVAAALGIPRVLVPAAPGVFSALGLLAAEVEHHFLRTHLHVLDEDLDVQTLYRLTSGMAHTALATLAQEGYARERVELRWAFDARYLGQSFELSAPFDVPEGRPLSANDVAAIVEAFGQAHERTYGHRAVDEPVELVNVRLAARGVPGAPWAIARGLPAMAASRSGTPPRSAPVGPSTRAVYLGPATGWLDVPVVDRGALARRASHAGPLIVEEYDATTLVPPGWQARLDQQGTIVLERCDER